ncbi:hypothetical protein F5Y12DRAFT_448094 [Xylaria sp. FL1777]|nr:hypothetical protein F5Y12DRAFT_448094 [Xylaria sp. FL1777]
MIRQPFNSAVGRTRGDLSRVAEGIAASVRAFSTAQQLAVPPRQDHDNDGSRPTGRQRAAAAFSDLVDLNSSEDSPRPPGSPFVAPRKLDLRSASGRLTGPIAPHVGGPKIIRSGFLGRGGAMMPGGRMGVGRTLGAALPNRRRAGAGGREGRGGRKRNQKEKEEDSGPAEDKWPPEVLALRETREVGSVQPFDPSISLADLAGWGPAVATAGSRVAKDETVMRQARILGSGQPFHPLNLSSLDETWRRYKAGSGVFFPNEETKKFSADAMGLEAFPPVPKETKDAVLQSALLGTYQGPQYADLKDTLGAVRNYVKREASWSSDAERRIEEKVRSLLAGGRRGPASAAGGARASA